MNEIFCLSSKAGPAVIGTGPVITGGGGALLMGTVACTSGGPWLGVTTVPVAMTCATAFITGEFNIDVNVLV